MTKSNGITAYSYSALTAYEQCPAKFADQRIHKNKPPTSPALEKGIRVHQELKDYVEGKEVDVSYVDKNCMKMLDVMRTISPLLELEVALDSDFKPVSWFSKSAYLRVIYDVLIPYGDGSCTIIDYKTGKENDDYEDQLYLFAGTQFKINPALKFADTRLLYVETGTEKTIHVKREEGLERFSEIDTRGQQLISATTFPERPNKYCPWCHLRKSAGGKCTQNF